MLEELTRDECLSLLAQVRIGRIVYEDEHGLAAVPVNFALAGDQVVFRTADGDKLRGTRGDQHVAFEVDQIDGAEHSGWSVLVRGTSEEVDMDSVPALLKRMEGEPPLPWAKSIHNIWVAITPKTITGRRLGETAEEDFF